MGQKISVDSATLMNKGLELIEACHLFSISEHFCYSCCSSTKYYSFHGAICGWITLAQMGNPDMCTPIAHALAWPQRLMTDVPALNLFETAQLNFQAPDNIKFPALKFSSSSHACGWVSTYNFECCQ